MAFRSSGHFEQSYSKCPVCDKKGLYRLSIVTNEAEGMGETMQRCKYCQHTQDHRKTDLKQEA